MNGFDLILVEKGFGLDAYIKFSNMPCSYRLSVPGINNNSQMPLYPRNNLYQSYNMKDHF